MIPQTNQIYQGDCRGIKHVVSFSGGKDSTTMLLRMIELNMQIDEIRYFDSGFWQFPDIQNHVDKIEKYIKKPIIRLKPKKPYDYYFTEHVKTKGKNKGKKGYGFSSMTTRWCTRIKIDAINKGLKKDDILYIGFTVGETKRAEKMKQREKFEVKFPLIEWQMTEKDCLKYCYSKGFNWNGLYKYFHQICNWCCPLQNLNDLRNLRKYYPDLWKRLLKMQEKSPNAFRMDGTTVFDLEKRFKKEDMQGKLFD